MQMLTMSDDGVVVIETLGRGGAVSTAPHADLASIAEKEAPSHGSTKDNAAIWRGNAFPLWQRLCRRLKPLPSPVIAYSLTGNSLTLWRTQVSRSHHEVRNESAPSISGGILKSKLWRVFEV